MDMYSAYVYFNHGRALCRHPRDLLAKAQCQSILNVAASVCWLYRTGRCMVLRVAVDAALDAGSKKML